MKSTLSLLFFFFFIQINLNGQAAILRGTHFGDIDNVALGPKNVDKFYPAQAEKYIGRYTKLRDSLENYYNKLEIKTNSIVSVFKKNKEKIEDNNAVLTRIELKLQLLEIKIHEWIIHKKKADKFYDFFSTNLDSLHCYTFVINGDTILNQYLEISTASKNNENNYFEFINDKITAVNVIYNDKITLHKNGSLYNAGYLHREIGLGDYVIYEWDFYSFLLEFLYYGNTPDYDPNKSFDFNQSGFLKRIEILFSSFTFDAENIDLFRKIDFVPKVVYHDIKYKGSPTHFIPDDWIRSDCK